MSATDPRAAITLRPIGWVRSPYARRFGTPQQASAIDSDAEAVLELDPDLIPELALRDLPDFRLLKSS